MSFALEEARLQRYVKGTAVSPPSLKAKKDDGKDQIEKICEFQDNARKEAAKIGKICTDKL